MSVNRESHLFLARYLPPSLAGEIVSKDPAPPGFAVCYFRQGREAMSHLWNELAKVQPRQREILLPGFLCQAVVDTVTAQGMTPVFLDVDPQTLTVLPDEVQKKYSSNTLAVMEAPYFGLPAVAPAALRKIIGITPLILDAAQWAGIEHVPEDYDCLILSFGLGKGTDYFGGALAYRPSLAWQPAGMAKQSSLAFFAAHAKVEIQRELLGAVRLRPFFERHWDKQIRAAKQMGEQGNVAMLRDRAVAELKRRYGAFHRTLVRARKRAHLLLELPAVQRRFPVPDVTRLAEATFLRFPLLMDTAEEKENILAYSRNLNLGLSSADEPQRGDLPGVQRVNATLVKLAYLGSLNELEFAHLKINLERFFKNGK